jgi:hypothetical protein
VLAPKRGPGRPRKLPTAGLSRPERELANLLMVVGLSRAEHLIAGLKRTLGV